MSHRTRDAKNRLRVRAAGLVVSALFLAPGTTLATPSPIRLLQSDSGATILEVVPGEPVLNATPDGVELRFDDHTWSRELVPGAPDLPSTTVLVGVPPGARVTHRVTIEDERVLAGVRARPAPAPVPGRAGEVPALRYNERPEFYTRVFPGTRVRLSAPSALRDLEVVAVTVWPAVHDPAAGGLVVAGRIRITIETAGGVVTAARLPPLPDADRRFYEGSIINASVAETWRRARVSRRSKRTTEHGFFSAATWVKLEVEPEIVGGHWGLRPTLLTGSELEAAGVPISSVDPATVRLFWGGGLEPPENVSPRSLTAPTFMSECAIEVVDGGTSGRLDPGDTVLWVGQGTSGWLDDFTGSGYALDHHEHLPTGAGIYWLTWGGDFSQPPRRVTLTTAAPDPVAPEFTTGQSRRHWEENRRYWPDLFEAGSVKWEKWWFSGTLADRGGPFAIPVPAPGVAPGTTGELRVRLWGLTNMGRGAIRDHYIFASWNGEPILSPAGQDTFAWNGPRTPTQPGASGRLDIEPTGLTLGETNLLGIRALQINDPSTPNRRDESLLAWYQLRYDRVLDLAGESWIEFATPEGLQGTVNFAIQSVDAGTRVIEITDPYTPVAITGERQGTTLRFSTVLTAGVVRKYWVGSVADFERVRAASVDQSFPDLRTPNHRARYLVIAHDTLIDFATRLAAAHPTLPGETMPATSMAVRVSDIYDEFGWGLKSVRAIRNFIDYAVHTWVEDGRPLYVCLLGDASSDPRDNFGGGDEETDLLPAPTFWNWIGGSFGGSDYLSDDWYVQTFKADPDSLEVPPDRLTDLFVGRIPAFTREEARVMVDEKTIPALLDPAPGPWRQRVLISADDDIASGQQEGFRHVRSSERVMSAFPAEIERVKVYLHDYPRIEGGFKPAARERFIEVFNDGASLVNYIGHGSPLVMAHENLFGVAHVGRLTNGARLPLFFTFSCTVNRFDGPPGIGEELVKWRGGGALASTGSTDLAFGSPNEILNTGTFDRLFENGDFTRPRSLGEALAGAKNTQVLDSDFRFRNARKYVLLGDPALTLPVPGHRIELSARESGGAASDTLVAGRPLTLSGQVLEAGGGPRTGATGDVVVWVRDSADLRHVAPGFPGFPVSGRDIFRSTLPLTGGAFTTSFVVPIDAWQSLTGARQLGELRAFLEDPAGAALGAVPVYLDVASAPASEPPPAGGPTIAAFFDGGPGGVLPGAILHIQVEDPSGINIVGNTPANSLFMRIDEELTVVMNDLFNYVPGSATEGTVDYRLPDLEPGPHVARIFASDNYLNRSQHDVLFHVVTPGDLRILDAGLYPNPFDPRAGGRGTMLGFTIREPAEVDVRVWTVSGRLVRDRFVELSGPLDPGSHQIHWNGRDEDGDFVANGVYIVKISARSLLTRETTSTVVRSVVSR